MNPRTWLAVLLLFLCTTMVVIGVVASRRAEERRLATLKEHLQEQIDETKHNLLDPNVLHEVATTMPNPPGPHSPSDMMTVEYLDQRSLADCYIQAGLMISEKCQEGRQQLPCFKAAGAAMMLLGSCLEDEGRR